MATGQAWEIPTSTGYDRHRVATVAGVWSNWRTEGFTIECSPNPELGPPRNFEPCNPARTGAPIALALSSLLAAVAVLRPGVARYSSACLTGRSGCPAFQQHSVKVKAEEEVFIGRCRFEVRGRRYILMSFSRLTPARGTQSTV